MTASDFTARWNAIVERDVAKAAAAGVFDIREEVSLVTAPAHVLRSREICQDAAEFLFTAGLPKGCAPFLSFSEVSKGPPLLIDVYGRHQFEAEDVGRLHSFYALGTDGSGNPICLDVSKKGEIVMLDHEDWFRTSTFVASSVALLAEALLLVQEIRGEDFVEELERIDPPAASPASYLPNEVRMLRHH